MDHAPEEKHFGWTRSQRRVLILLFVLLLALLTTRYACNPVYVSNPQPEKPSRFDDLADRIDPNTADWPTLAALPGLGEKRARDIIVYRDQAKIDLPDHFPFTQPTDLLRIKGIGQAMVSAMEPYLMFPATQPVDSPPPR